ncbi:MAG TPA: hypothetical protein VMF61_10895 [Candidatus Acidoferrales bacterium]|nr:hypothetical protein [Candidatus Acidoferrales bacterium]
MIALLIVLVASLACHPCSAAAAAGRAPSPSVPRAEMLELRGALQAYDREIAALRSTQRVAGLRDPGAAAIGAALRLRARAGAAAARAESSTASGAGEYRAREALALGTIRSETAALDADADVRGAIERGLEPPEFVGSARADLDAYRHELETEAGAAVAAYQASMALRARNAIAARATQLRERESALAYDLARRDGTQRMMLRLKLADLHLEPPSRARLRAQLDAIDRRDAGAVAAMRQADAAQLAGYRTVVYARGARQGAAMSQRLQAEAAKALALRARVFRAQRAGASARIAFAFAGGLPSASDVTGQLGPLDDFDPAAEAGSIAAALSHASAGVATRFDALRAADDASQKATVAQIAALQRARNRLAAAIAAAEAGSGAAASRYRRPKPSE